MRTIRFVVTLAALCLLVPPLAAAGPKRGIGIAFGAASFTNETGSGGTPQTYDSSGIAFMFDGQIPVGDSSSINILYVIDSTPSEVTFTNETPIDNALIGQNTLALQYRLWPSDSFFIGAHVGFFYQTITFQSFQPESGSGLLYGAAMGIEVDAANNNQWIIVVQYDKAPSVSVVTGLDPSDVSGFTALVGIRIVR